MAGLIIETPEEVNQILKEIVEYTILGLVEDQAEVKQFYLERIYISLAMNLQEVRDRLGIEIGAPPDE